MKLPIALAAALLATGFVGASTEKAAAVVYCTYVSYPAGCVVRPGVVLRPRPVARAVATPGVVRRGWAGGLVPLSACRRDRPDRRDSWAFQP